MLPRTSSRDTVEVASLMESTGQPMKIQMSQSTTDILEMVTPLHHLLSSYFHRLEVSTVCHAAWSTFPK